MGRAGGRGSWTKALQQQSSARLSQPNTTPTATPTATPSASPQIVGKTSTWIDPDSADPALAAKSAAALAQELEWASFLGLQAVLITPPRELHAAVNFSRIVNRALEGLSHMALWVKLPLAGGSSGGGSSGGGRGQQQRAASDGDAAEAEQPGARDPWDDWQQLFALCERSNLLGAVLEVQPDLPPVPLVRRWLGQPLKALLLPTAVFTTNKRGYPVLSKAHQDLAALAFRYGVQIVVTGGSRHRVAPAPVAPPPPAATAPAEDGVSSSAGAAGAAAGGDGAVEAFPIVNPGESHPLRPYWEYLCYLFRRVEDLSAAEVLEAGYRDYLQVGDGCGGGGGERWLVCSGGRRGSDGWREEVLGAGGGGNRSGKTAHVSSCTQNHPPSSPGPPPAPDGQPGEPDVRDV